MNSFEAQLHAYRKEIDDLDQTLIRCLAARFELSEQIASIKAIAGVPVRQPGRASQVAQMYQRIGASLAIHPGFLSGLFEVVHAESCRRQRLFLASRSWRYIGYLGPKGTFSEDAACGLMRRLSLDAELVPCPSIEAVVEGVANEVVDVAVLPIENRLSGPVERTQHALEAATGLQVCDEWWLPVAQCLLALQGTEPAQIREVWSARPALDQCTQWIAQHGHRTCVFDSTAKAAQAVHESGRKDVAAIGSQRIADGLGLVVLNADVADAPDNATRFAVIAHKPDPRT